MEDTGFLIGDTVLYLGWEWTVTDVDVREKKDIWLRIENMSQSGNYNRTVVTGNAIKLVTTIKRWKAR